MFICGYTVIIILICTFIPCNTHFLLLNYSWKPHFCYNLILSPMQCHDLQEFISLINQLIAKYKEKISPFLQEVFMPVVQSIATCLNHPFDSADLEVCLCVVCVWMHACVCMYVFHLVDFLLSSACQYDHCNCAFWRAANCNWRLPVSDTLNVTFCFSRSIGSDRTFKSRISSSSTP